MINFIDLLLPVLLIAAAYVGRHRGLIRQSLALIGILLGTLIAAFIYSLLAYLTESSLLRAVVLGMIIVAVTFLSYDLFAAIGRRVQREPFFRKFSGSLYDTIGSALVSGLSVFVVIWLGILLFGAVLPTTAKGMIKGSQIFGFTTQYIRPPALIGNVGQLLQPFSSPDVFASDEPSFDTTSLPVAERYEELDKSLARVKKSVVKINTWGCGSVGAGSGFIVGSNLVMTNAHVVAGADRISMDNNGITHVAKAVLFDPGLDIAILLTNSNLVGDPLIPRSSGLAPGAIGAVLGYPGGNQLTSDDVVILQSIQAEGFDIYQKNKVKRSIYVVRSNIIPGDSGGPLIDINGRLAGIIIGHSSSDGRVGFIINASQISETIKTAHDLKDTVGTGSCAGV